MPISEEAKPNPMVKPEIPKVLMGRGGYLSNEERIKKDEAELEEMKKQVALNMGYELVDHRLELFGKKIKK